LHVVLDQRVRGPPVHRDEDRPAARGRGTVEGDIPGSIESANIYVPCKIKPYRVVPVFQPLPTTKSPAPENVTEYPLLDGLKLTLPLVL
jgi:hypothetical protein